LNDEERTIEFVGSTAAEDRYGDTIVQAGWELATSSKFGHTPRGSGSERRG